MVGASSYGLFRGDKASVWRSLLWHDEIGKDNITVEARWASHASRAEKFMGALDVAPLSDGPRKAQARAAPLGTGRGTKV